MPSISLVALVGLVLAAGPQSGPLPALNYSVSPPEPLVGPPAAPIEQVPVPAAYGEGPAEMPRPPRGVWWYGARLPYPLPPQVYYPTWDTPVDLLFGHPPMGTPAYEVPQRPAAPAFWEPLDW
jgi:hypothetical protein